MMASSTSFQQVPDDVVLNHILCRLDTITRVRFAAVCRSWRALSRQAPPPIPCLFVIDCTDTTSALTQRPSLFDPFSATNHLLLRPKEKMDCTIAGCHGPYLAFTALPWPRRFFLLNPFSGDTLQLPSTARHLDGRRYFMGSLQRAQLSSTPPHACLSAVVVDSKVYICRPGQDEWVASPPVHKAIYDLIFYKDELYCVSYNACIFAFDLPRNDHELLRPTPRTVTVGNKDRKRQDIRHMDHKYIVMHYLVESDGELLVATQYELAQATGAPPRIIFDLHRLGEDGQLVWVEDLGERMLFLGRGSSKSWIGSVPNEFFRKNCIYFVHINGSNSFRLGRFCVGKGEQQLGPSSFAEFHPDPLPKIYSFPLWITPDI